MSKTKCGVRVRGSNIHQEDICTKRNLTKKSDSITKAEKGLLRLRIKEETTSWKDVLVQKGSSRKNCTKRQCPESKECGDEKPQGMSRKERPV